MPMDKSIDSSCCICLLKGGLKGSSIEQVKINGEFSPQLISGRVNVEMIH